MCAEARWTVPILAVLYVSEVGLYFRCTPLPIGLPPLPPWQHAYGISFGARDWLLRRPWLLPLLTLYHPSACAGTAAGAAWCWNGSRNSSGFWGAWQKKKWLYSACISLPNWFTVWPCKRLYGHIRQCGAGVEVNIGSSSSLSWRFCQRNAHLTIPLRVC